MVNCHGIWGQNLDIARAAIVNELDNRTNKIRLVDRFYSIRSEVILSNKVELDSIFSEGDINLILKAASLNEDKVDTERIITKDTNFRLYPFGEVEVLARKNHSSKVVDEIRKITKTDRSKIYNYRFFEVSTPIIITDHAILLYREDPVSMLAVSYLVVLKKVGSQWRVVKKINYAIS